MPYVNTDNPNCPNCNKSGLAILPVRYAVVPLIAGATLPATLGNKVTSVVLKHHKYALRTLRKGYLYLYYEKHARGRHIKWEVYSVAEGGTLWKQLSIGAIQEITDIQCSRKAHLIPASVITIDTPEKCGRVWMAFSEHPWSEETFKDFAQDEKLRDRRMQTFAPAVWIKSRGYQHGLEATEANLNEIVEYKTGFVLSALGGTGVKDISAPDGSFKKEVLHHCSTVHPLTVRRDDKATLADMMKKAGERSDKSPHAPIIIALWDSVGIAHELNGFRNDAAGWIKKYSIERERELGAAVSIQGAKKALEGRAEDHVQSIADIGIFNWSAAHTQARMQTQDSGSSSNGAERARQADLCARWERDAAAGAPAHLANQRKLSLGLSEREWQLKMADIDADIAAASTPNGAAGTSQVQQRDARAEAWSKDAVAQAWPKYEALIDRMALDRFTTTYHGFLATATSLIDARTEDVVAWLKSKSLHDALTEFHQDDLGDGLAFESTVGSLIMGITSSPEGEAYIQVLVEEAKCSERNLVWRAIAFNQREAREELDRALTYIISVKEKSFTDASLSTAENSIKYFAKLGQLVSKALSLHNALCKPGVIRPPTGGQEKILLTVGSLFMRPYMKIGVDTLAGWLVHGLIMVRTGSDYKKVLGLLVAEAKLGKIERANTILLMSVGKAFAKASVSAERKAWMEKWAALVNDADMPKSEGDLKSPGSFNEAREIRFSIVATLLQTIYVAKLYFEAGDDPLNQKLRGELWAAGMSLCAGISDIGALAIKIVNPLQDAALSYQSLKLGGGLLSVGAAWMNFQNDIVTAKKNRLAGHDDLAYLYYIKAGANAAIGLFSGINSISYTKPAFELIARNFPTSILGRAASLVPRGGLYLAEKLILKRAILIFCGIEFSVAVIALEILVWKFSDDELQKCCRYCAFGKVPSNRTMSTAAQKFGFDLALVEVI